MDANNAAQAVKTQIIAAFTPNPYPGDDNIADDNSGNHFECNDVADFFMGQQWQDVTWEILQTYDGDKTACLNFMSAEAFRYYLPTYLLIALDNYREGPSSFTIYKLTPPRDQDLRSWWLDRVNGFTAAQRDAIRAFLRYIKEAHGDDFGFDPGLDKAIVFWEEQP